MHRKHREQPEYGWKSDGAACNHAYLIPVIERAIFDYRMRENRLGKLRVFDAGCGNGFLVGRFLDCGFIVAGCDESKSAIQCARASHASGRFEVLSVYDDIAEIFDREWDIVVASEVIEHLCSPALFVQRVRDLLKPGGLFIISTPYHGYLKNMALAVTGAFDHHFTALWEGGHIKFWSYKTLSILLREHGFVEPRFFGAGRLPFLWKSMVVTALKPL